MHQTMPPGEFGFGLREFQFERLAACTNSSFLQCEIVQNAVRSSSDTKSEQKIFLLTEAKCTNSKRVTQSGWCHAFSDCGVWNDV